VYELHLRAGGLATTRSHELSLANRSGNNERASAGSQIITSPIRGCSLKPRYNTKFRMQIKRMNPASTAEIQEVITDCAGNSDLQIMGDLVRVIANTGLHNGELRSLQISDIDTGGNWFTVSGTRRKNGGKRVLPIRAKTLAALISLHKLNPQSVFVLGDSPRTRFDNAIRKLKTAAPQFARRRLWFYSVRSNFEHRLMSAGIPSGVVKYCLGHRNLDDVLLGLSLTPQQGLFIVRRSMEKFLEEL
jgi:integrase